MRRGATRRFSLCSADPDLGLPVRPPPLPGDDGEARGSTLDARRAAGWTRTASSSFSSGPSPGSSALLARPPGRRAPPERAQGCEVARSARGSGSLGVSSTLGTDANRGSFRSHRNAARPRKPWPMCSWRSSPDPSGARLSLRWTASTRATPSRLAHSSITASYPFRVRMSWPLAKRWQVSRQTPRRSGRAERPMIAASSAIVRPSACPAPAVFSRAIRTR